MRILANWTIHRLVAAIFAISLEREMKVGWFGQMQTSCEVMESSETQLELLVGKKERLVAAWSTPPFWPIKYL
jgi:hypothetical protein